MIAFFNTNPLMYHLVVTLAAFGLFVAGNATGVNQIIISNHIIMALMFSPFLGIPGYSNTFRRANRTFDPSIRTEVIVESTRLCYIAFILCKVYAIYYFFGLVVMALAPDIPYIGFFGLFLLLTTFASYTEYNLGFFLTVIWVNLVTLAVGYWFVGLDPSFFAIMFLFSMFTTRASTVYYGAVNSVNRNPLIENDEIFSGRLIW